MEPGSAEARRALEFRPTRVRITITPPGAKFPAKETSAGPAAGNRRPLIWAVPIPGQVKNLPPRRRRGGSGEGQRQLSDKLKTYRHEGEGMDGAGIG